jgi:hypothetical protein
MSMGKRKRVRATELWVPTTDLPMAPSHPFYRRLNDILRAGDFDAFVERTCQKFLRGAHGPSESGARRVLPALAARLL